MLHILSVEFGFYLNGLGKTNSFGTAAFPSRNFTDTRILLSSTHFNVDVYCMQCAVWPRSVLDVNSFSHYNIRG
jgi:hypothetical protein